MEYITKILDALKNIYIVVRDTTISLAKKIDIRVAFIIGVIILLGAIIFYAIYFYIEMYKARRILMESTLPSLDADDLSETSVAMRKVSEFIEVEVATSQDDKVIPSDSFSIEDNDKMFYIQVSSEVNALLLPEGEDLLPKIDDEILGKKTDSKHQHEVDIAAIISDEEGQDELDYIHREVSVDDGSVLVERSVDGDVRVTTEIEAAETPEMIEEFKNTIDDMEEE